MEVNKAFERSCYKFEVGDVVAFSDNVREAPYEGVGVVFDKRTMWYGDVMAHPQDGVTQIHVHWFDPKYNAWYAEHTLVLKKVEVNNETD